MLGVVVGGGEGVDVETRACVLGPVVVTDTHDDGFDSDSPRDVGCSILRVVDFVRFRNVVIVGGDDPVWPRSGFPDEVPDCLGEGGYVSRVLPR